MARVYDGITDRQREWIARQPLFFVGTAPLDAEGHVNVSPKGPIGSLRVIEAHRVAYLDVMGSGAETLAHVRENGRIVVMLCAFEGPPRILRLHGRAQVRMAGDPEFAALLERFGFEDPTIPEARRAIVDVAVTRVADSCGYRVPLLHYDGEREHLPLASAKRLRTTGGPAELRAFEAKRNAESLDGLPAVPAAFGEA
jgi:predicted pyridoxine 5'-phosphate oxidase superfamily flavin-nucleotide-binding protein